MAAALLSIALTCGIGAQSNEAQSQGIGKKDINVLVLVYDPVLKTQGNLKLHEFLHWSDPYRLTLKLVEDLRMVSYGYVNYHVVEMLEFDGYPTKRNGFTYDEKGFLGVLKDPKTAAQPRRHRRLLQQLVAVHRELRRGDQEPPASRRDIPEGPDGDVRAGVEEVARPKQRRQRAGRVAQDRAVGHVILDRRPHLSEQHR